MCTQLKKDMIDVLGEEVKAVEELIEEMEAKEDTESVEEIEVEAEKDGIKDAELKKDEYLLEHDTDPLEEQLEEALVEKEEEEGGCRQTSFDEGWQPVCSEGWGHGHLGEHASHAPSWSIGG
jgi:hypothetical protein